MELRLMRERASAEKEVITGLMLAKNKPKNCINYAVAICLSLEENCLRD